MPGSAAGVGCGLQVGSLRPMSGLAQKAAPIAESRTESQRAAFEVAVGGNGGIAKGRPASFAAARTALSSTVSDDPNSARSPNDGLFHSTIDGTYPNSAGVRRSDRGADPRLGDCDRRAHGSLCPGLPPPFRQRVGTSIGHRRGLAAPMLQT